MKVVEVGNEEEGSREVFSSRERIRGDAFEVVHCGYIKTTPGWLSSLWTSLMAFEVDTVFKGKGKVYKRRWLDWPESGSQAEQWTSRLAVCYCA